MKIKNEILLNVGTSSSVDRENFDTDPIGMIKIWPNSTIIDKWKPCNGEEISRSTFSDLYNIIGNQYGDGNENNTFNLPNMNDGNFIRQSDGDINLGVTGGDERVTLTLNQLPAHIHEYDSARTGSPTKARQGGSTTTTSSSTGGTNGATQSHENRPEFRKITVDNKGAIRFGYNNKRRSFKCRQMESHECNKSNYNRDE